MQIFELEGYDFIELNKLMKIMNLVGSGGEAKQFIDEGLVLVNGQVEKQRRKKLRTGDVVSFEGEEVKVQ
ncbi:RNA-binding S4 domain-containing protein [Ekhidna sp.]|jgi:ribosome-associated protein|uniref:RNA-binding S4 domain-containing protein n=1 Tax=Ekhidna sp. TaxID=2608089 RepID=UPI0032EE655E